VNTGPRTMTQPQQGPAGMCGRMESAGIDVADDSPCPARTAVLASGGAGGEVNTGLRTMTCSPTRAAWLACAERWSVGHVKDDSLCPSKDCRAGICIDGEWNTSRTMTCVNKGCLAGAGRMESAGTMSRTIACAPARTAAGILVG
jgi:hypothetical protein